MAPRRHPGSHFERHLHRLDHGNFFSFDELHTSMEDAPSFVVQEWATSNDQLQQLQMLLHASSVEVAPRTLSHRQLLLPTLNKRELKQCSARNKGVLSRSFLGAWGFAGAKQDNWGGQSLQHSCQRHYCATGTELGWILPPWVAMIHVLEDSWGHREAKVCSDYEQLMKMKVVKARREDCCDDAAKRAEGCAAKSGEGSEGWREKKEEASSSAPPSRLPKFSETSVSLAPLNRSKRFFIFLLTYILWGLWRLTDKWGWKQQSLCACTSRINLEV